MKHMQLSVLTIPLLLMCFGANAQDQSGLSERMAYYSTEVSGKVDPDRIPFNSKMDFFFRQYYVVYVNKVSTILPASDAAKLATFVRQEDGRRQKSTVRLARQKEEICAEVDILSAEAVAAKIEQMDSNNAADVSKSYRTMMNSLSVDGRIALENLIAKEITPNLVYSEMNTVGLWREYPDVFLQQLKFFCTTDPVELQRLVQQALEAEGQTNQSSSSSSTFGTLPD